MEEGDRRRSRSAREPMAREDKIALALILLLIGGLTIGALFGLSFILGTLGSIMDFASTGMDFKSSFKVSLVVSFMFMVIFALVAGDGFVGELGVMVISFFVMVLFFTVSIALIL